MIRKITIAIWAIFSTSSALCQDEIKISTVNLKIKSNGSWFSSSGSLYLLKGDGRTHAADIGEDGTLDAEVKCKAGDRFQAEATSPMDRPAPPPHVRCSQQLSFKYVRAVIAGLSEMDLPPSVIAALKPKLYSELTIRSAMADIPEASIAFQDAAIRSTAILLGDKKLDQYVTRDLLQNSKLVFNAAGIDALKAKQHDAGIKPSGSLDFATQSIFAQEAFKIQNTSTWKTPELTCKKTAGNISCSPNAQSITGVKAFTIPPLNSATSSQY